MLLIFKLPDHRLFEFIRFTEMMDISIIVAFKEESLFNTQVTGYIKLNKNPNIPKEIQLEKLNEKFPNYTKEA